MSHDEWDGARKKGLSGCMCVACCKYLCPIQYVYCIYIYIYNYIYNTSCLISNISYLINDPKSNNDIHIFSYLLIPNSRKRRSCTCRRSSPRPVRSSSPSAVVGRGWRSAGAGCAMAWNERFLEKLGILEHVKLLNLASLFECFLFLNLF